MVSSIVYVATTLVCVLCVCANVRFVPKERYNASLQVKTRQGIIQGRESVSVNGKKIFVYGNIPFAEPPTNNLRFQAPKPNKRWKGVLDGTEEAVGCTEMLFRLTGITFLGEEDCLYLNVYTPQIPISTNGGLPVMVWIFGGGFIEGNSSSVIYGPDYFVENGVIVVKLNYRLGLFGFLSTGDMASPGNYGLKDQNAAMKWTKGNIKFFGGDPNRITIFGESAGACSVIHHLISKQSRGLFSGAIAMSGETLTPWCNKKSPTSVATGIANRLKIDPRNTTNLMEVLRSLSIHKLRDLQLRLSVVHGMQIYNEGLPFTPTIEPEHQGAFITESTYNLLQKGDIAKVPLLIGRNSLELKVFAIAFPLFRFATLLFDISSGFLTSPLNVPVRRSSQIGQQIVKQYFQSNSFSTGTEMEIIEFLSDVYFNIPIDRTIKLLYKHIPVYSYVFNYNAKILVPAYRKYVGFSPVRSDSVTGAGHAEEIPLFFNFLDIPMTYPTDRLIKDRLVTLWTNFAKHSNPTPDSDRLFQNVTWPKVESAENVPYLVIGEEMEVRTNFRNKYMRFWEELPSRDGRQHNY